MWAPRWGAGTQGLELPPRVLRSRQLDPKGIPPQVCPQGMWYPWHPGLKLFAQHPHPFLICSCPSCGCVCKRVPEPWSEMELGMPGQCHAASHRWRF